MAMGCEGLVFADDRGRSQFVKAQARANLFELFADQVSLALAQYCHNENRLRSDKPMTHPKLQEILAKLKDYLASVYGERLTSLVLFGSQARRDATTHSDIDVMIVLAEEIDIPLENKRLSEFVAALCLEYDVVITHVWTGLQDWQTRQNPLLINIRREGVTV